MRAEGSHVPNKLKWARGGVDLLRFSGIFAKKGKSEYFYADKNSINVGRYKKSA